MSFLETIAVLVTVSAVSLTILRSRWCWAWNFVAALLYAILFYESKLYAEVILQLVFMGMYVYGFQQWRQERDREHVELEIQKIHLKAVVLQGLIAGGMGLALGSVLHSMTDAAVPFLDAQLAAFSLLATYWTSQKYIATWPLWVVLDIIYVAMFGYKGLFLTALLYTGLVFLAVMGWWQWLKVSHQQQNRLSTI